MYSLEVTKAFLFHGDPDCKTTWSYGLPSPSMIFQKSQPPINEGGSHDDDANICFNLSSNFKINFNIVCIG